MDKRARDFLWDWVNEEDLEVFERALSDEPSDQSADGPQAEKIRAVSDFAPIKERVRKGPKRRKDIVREGWAYHVSRWPLLAIIFLVIFLEFLGYLAVRQLVNIFEYLVAWRGYRGKLRAALRNASTFEEWRERALALDNYLRLSDWKRSPPNAYYDSPLIRRVLRSLREMREKDDVEGVRTILEVALRSNFAGVESFRLYSETFYGTKELVEEYVDEVARSIAFVRTAPTSAISLEEKERFFRYSAKNLGSTALCLSGGASFGYYHFGVVRALLDTGLLPRVITGTSAGAIVAAFTCTRTDDELKEMLVPELANRILACHEPFQQWTARAWKTGARFDTLDWARKATFFTLGSMTFKEAFERTGRILNVSVIPYDTHSPTKLLNYLTAPDCVIYTAVIASAAVPGILNPVVLMTKDKDGKVHPWEFQGKHKDGSLRVDIPLQSLHLLYNVNFSIVSQVNPHIHLFHFAPRGAPGRPVSHRSGKGWRGGFFLSAAEQFLKLELTKNFRVIRDLELLPELGGQNWSAVFLQKFEGTVTIWPKSRLWDWFRILTDPDPDELSRMIRVGQAVTWPKIKMIENRMKIERQLDLAREEIHTQLAAAASSGRMHRDSSFDMHVKRCAVSPEADAAIEMGATETDLDANIDSSTDGEADILGLHPLATPSAGTSSKETKGLEHANKRRKQILARLGLKYGVGIRFGNFGEESDEQRSRPATEFIPMCDPGPRINWKSNPAYTTSLLTQALSPTLALPRAQLHNLFLTDSHLSRIGKAQKARDVRAITEKVFIVRGAEEDKEEKRIKQAASLSRRIASLAKEYTIDIDDINKEPHGRRAEFIDDLRLQAPWWDDLHSILQDHPSFPRLDGGIPVPAGGAVAGPGPAAMAVAAAAQAQAQAQAQHDEYDEELDDDMDEEYAMQGVEFTPQPQPHPHLPVGHYSPVHPPAFHPADAASPEANRCYKCDQALNPAMAEEHMRLCFDATDEGREISGIFTPECFVCGRDLQALSNRARDQHIEQCVSAPVIVEEFDVFYCTEKTRPKDDVGNPVECSMCFEDFDVGSKLARLSCFCVFHEACMTSWWAPKVDGSKGKFCPVHSEDAKK